MIRLYVSRSGDNRRVTISRTYTATDGSTKDDGAIVLDEHELYELEKFLSALRDIGYPADTSIGFPDSILMRPRR